MEGRLLWSLQGKGREEGELLGSKSLAPHICVLSSKSGESQSGQFCKQDKIAQNNKTKLLGITKYETTFEGENQKSDVEQMNDE